MPFYHDIVDTTATASYLCVHFWGPATTQDALHAVSARAVAKLHRRHWGHSTPTRLLLSAVSSH